MHKIEFQILTQVGNDFVEWYIIWDTKSYRILYCLQMQIVKYMYTKQRVAYQCSVLSDSRPKSCPQTNGYKHLSVNLHNTLGRCSIQSTQFPHKPMVISI